ncbi:MAG: phosphopyruvate hydratase [Proteobacteria bacterium]|nr:phosphopyruvate hydratase [Pseudomonadota bacterium]
MTLSIQSVQGIEILDSRGNPTVMAIVTLSDGRQVSGAVPSGASTGAHEAVELRDKDGRYDGKGVRQAIHNLQNIIAPALVGQAAGDLSAIDKIMLDLDGTPNKANLGANSILAVSIACARARALVDGVELYASFSDRGAHRLPVPMMNVLNGGAHANNSIDFQEFMLVPFAAGSFSEAVRWGAQMYHVLRRRLAREGISTAVGDEGGFAPDYSSEAQALDCLMECIVEAGFKPGTEVSIALDVASTEFFSDGVYSLASSGRRFEAPAFADYLVELSRQYPISSVEDGMAEDDYGGWQYLTAQMQAQADKLAFGRMALIGDDLFVTSSSRLRRGIDEKWANAILVKVNQIGTVSETIETVSLAHENSFTSVMSHRSGETEDSFIADLAVALGAPMIKTGAPCRSDRNAKYNRLLVIEAALAGRAVYAGKGFIHPQ